VRTEDGCIIYRCLNGEPEAFGLLVDKYKAGIYAFVYNKLLNFQDAQDVTQEAFLQAYRDLRALRRWESFVFWLYRIAHNCCAKWLQTRSRRPDCSFIEDQDQRALESYSMETYRTSQVSESLREALHSLPEIQRQALMLRYFGGMNSNEIARSLGTSPSAIRKRLSRARRQLKEEMIAIMDTAFEGQKLQASFTFRIVEAIKWVKVHPTPRMTELPWGLSLAAGLTIVVISLSSYLSMSHNMDAASGGMTSHKGKLMRMNQGTMDTLVNPTRSAAGSWDIQSVVLLVSQADDGTKPITAGSHASANAGQRQAITIDLPGLPDHARKLEMVLVQPGTFIMGSPEEHGRSSSYWSPHKVTITRPFYIGKYEVTQAQWEALGSRNRSKFRGKPDYPVEKVSWRECQKFIKRLNALGQGTFRLPTEAEWEYSCRAGTETPFSFPVRDENFREIASQYMWWREDNQQDGTKEVGLKLPNPWGLHDIHGNVYEWCSDRWESPRLRGSQADPRGPGNGWWKLIPFMVNRVFRGGCYGSVAAECRSAHRKYEQSMDYHYSIGFRLVREYPL